MDLRILIEPQEGVTEHEQVAAAQWAEDLGFSGFFRTDHLMPLGLRRSARSVAVNETWLTLALLAGETNNIQLGSMVTSVTFRHPGVLAVQVAQVALLSGGRLELGLGAGWNANEHRAYGLPFPSLAQRHQQLADTVRLFDQLWSTPSGTAFTFHGANLHLENCPVGPRPRNGPPALILGGKARPKGLRLAAQYAAEYNLDFPRPGEVVGARQRLDDACSEAGRRASPLRLSASHLVCVGKNMTDLRARADQSDIDLTLNLGGLVGTLTAVRTQLDELAALGVDRFYLQIPDPRDRAHFDLLAELLEVA